MIVAKRYLRMIAIASYHTPEMEPGSAIHPHILACFRIAYQSHARLDLDDVPSVRAPSEMHSQKLEDRRCLLNPTALLRTSWLNSFDFRHLGTWLDHLRNPLTPRQECFAPYAVGSFVEVAL